MFEFLFYFDGLNSNKFSDLVLITFEMQQIFYDVILNV